MLLSELLATPDLEPALRGLKVSGLTAESRMSAAALSLPSRPRRRRLSYVADAKSRGLRRRRSAAS
jgi:UDP-N-acetylmuramoyl-L-alanyl-D-glutamate--2,6-diaminopimelate ligase